MVVAAVFTAIVVNLPTSTSGTPIIPTITFGTPIIPAKLLFLVPHIADYVTVEAYLLPYVPPFAVFFVITVVAVVVAAVFTAIVVIPPTITSRTPIIPAKLLFLVPNFADYVTVVADLCPYVPPFAVFFVITVITLVVADAELLAPIVIGFALIAGDVFVTCTVIFAVAVFVFGTVVAIAAVAPAAGPLTDDAKIIAGHVVIHNTDIHACFVVIFALLADWSFFLELGHFNVGHFTNVLAYFIIVYPITIGVAVHPFGGEFCIVVVFSVGFISVPRLALAIDFVSVVVFFLDFIGFAGLNWNSFIQRCKIGFNPWPCKLSTGSGVSMC